jgi:hypothetical protein
MITRNAVVTFAGKDAEIRVSVKLRSGSTKQIFDQLREICDDTYFQGMRLLAIYFYDDERVG